MEAVNGTTRTVDAEVEAPCSPCGGTGSADKSKPVVCTACKGSGQTVMQDGFMATIVPCRKCGGEGTTMKNPCKSCGGGGTSRAQKSVEVVVPPGVDSGLNMRLAGQGSAGERGGPAGHLYVSLTVEKDPFFERDGADIHVTVPITMAQAVLGASVPVPTVRGEVELKVPPGTQPTDKLVLKGRGVRRLNGGPPGNQYVHLRVLVPKTLTPRQEAIMREFAASEAGSGTAGADPQYADEHVAKETSFFRDTIARIRKAIKAQPPGA